MKYTQINNCSSGSAEALPGGNINPLDTNFVIFKALNDNDYDFSSMTNNLKSKYKQLDLNLWSESYNCCALQFTPYFGLRGAWLNQEFRINGVGTDSASNPLTLASNFKSCLQGYGPQSGVDVEYSLGCGFKLEGRFGGAIFAARSSAQDHLSTASLLANIDVDTNESCWHVTPAVDGYLGVAYDWEVCCNPVKVYLGYEMHTIFNANFFSLVNYADYSTQGFTLGAGMNF